MVNIPCETWPKRHVNFSARMSNSRYHIVKNSKIKTLVKMLCEIFTNPCKMVKIPCERKSKCYAKRIKISKTPSRLRDNQNSVWEMHWEIIAHFSINCEKWPNNGREGQNAVWDLTFVVWFTLYGYVSRVTLYNTVYFFGIKNWWWLLAAKNI